MQRAFLKCTKCALLSGGSLVLAHQGLGHKMKEVEKAWHFLAIYYVLKSQIKTVISVKITEITDFLWAGLALLPSAKGPWNFQGARGFIGPSAPFWGILGQKWPKKSERRIQFWAWELAVSKNQRCVQSFQPNCSRICLSWKSWYMKVVSKWLDFTFWSCSYFGRALDFGSFSSFLRKKFLKILGAGWFFRA